MKLFSNLTVATIIAILAAIGMQGTYVYSTRLEHDYDERYEDILGAPEWWYDGYKDGQDHPFSHDRNEEYKEKGNQYYRAFIHGCMSIEGITRDACEDEDAIDS